MRRKTVFPIAAAILALASGGYSGEPIAGGLPRVRELLDKNRWNEALETALSMVRGPETGPETDAALGEALWRAGRLVEGGAALARAAQAPGADGRTLAAAAMARAAEGHSDEARALLERALERAPEDPYVLYRAAMAAADRAGAVEILERYLAKGESQDAELLQGARHTIDLYRTLGERPVWIVAARPDRVEIPLRAVPAGGGLAAGYVLEARVKDGKRLKLLLDTGASGLFAVERILSRGGFAPLSRDTVYGGGGRGSAASKRGLLAEIEFGGLKYKDALVSASSEELHPSGAFHGVIGLSVFSGYRVTLDLERGRLVLDRSETPVSGESERYWVVSGQMLVEVRTGSGETALMVLDTGASRSVLSKEFARALPEAKVGGSAVARGYAGPHPDAQTVKGVRLEFLGLEDRGDAKTAVDFAQRSRIGGVELSGLLGMDVLDGNVLVIDPGSHRVLVSPSRKD
jgi:tetratricopeptide (TPR) repeat protein